MTSTMGRLWATAEAMKQYPGLDEPLIINQSEVDHVAQYVHKIQARGCCITPSEMAAVMRYGNVAVFGRRILVI